MANEFRKKMKNETIDEDKKIFHELLIVTFSSEKQKYDALKTKYLTIVEDMKNDEWYHFALKLDMLIAEFEAFTQAYSEFAKLDHILAKNSKKKDIYQKELDNVIRSDKKIYGFVTKITKDDHITNLRFKISKCDEHIKVERKLIVLALQILLKIEIPMIKNRKKLRFHEIVTEFAQARVKKLHSELSFWDKVLESNEESINYESDILFSKMRDLKNQEPLNN